MARFRFGNREAGSAGFGFDHSGVSGFWTKLTLPNINFNILTLVIFIDFLLPLTHHTCLGLVFITTHPLMHSFPIDQ